MPPDGFIRVCNWDRFQQYKDRDPKWIKLHRSLNRNYEWSRLSEPARAHLIGIWLLAAELDNKIPLDEAWISVQIGAKSELALNELFTNGFIEQYDFVQECTEPYKSVPREEKRREEKRREEGGSKPPKTPQFSPPLPEDVQSYIDEKGYHFVAETFVDFYSSKGWMVGKNKMKDWKAACRTWEKRWKEDHPAEERGLDSDCRRLANQLGVAAGDIKRFYEENGYTPSDQDEVMEWLSTN